MQAATEPRDGTGGRQRKTHILLFFSRLSLLSSIIDLLGLLLLQSSLFTLCTKQV